MPANQEASADIAVIFQVVYDTPQGTVRLRVRDYTPAAAEQGVRCQIHLRGHYGIDEPVLVLRPNGSGLVQAGKPGNVAAPGVG